jgi:hypothetical protein
MLTKCRFCEFSRDTPLSKPILKVLTEEDLATEDLILWFHRLMKAHSFGSYNGIKVHMGRMHKEEAYYGIQPRIEYDDWERDQINAIAQKFEDHHAMNSLVVPGRPRVAKSSTTKWRYL